MTFAPEFSTPNAPHNQNIEALQQLERQLAREVLAVVEAASLASGRLMGRGDCHGADAAAVTAMRRMLDQMAMAGTIVIGEGERDEAPMLYIGEQVGHADRINNPLELDIAVDPLEGTNLVANGLPGAVATLALAPKGGLLHAPDTYMNKLVVGPRCKGHVSLTAPVAENLDSIARCLHRPVSDLTIVILDRPRHEQLINDVRQAGARIRLISDGDLMPALATAIEGTGIHAVMGIGGAPEAVLTAAAVKCLGGEIQAQFCWSNAEQRQRAERMGVVDTSPEKLYLTQELAPAEAIVFAACGITQGDLLKAVHYFGGGARTHSVLLGHATGLIRFVDTIHMNQPITTPVHL